MPRRPPRAKARRVARPAPLVDAESAKRALCAAVFADPAVITHALSHEVAGRFFIDRHQHEDLVQFDMVIDCAGEVIADGRAFVISGTTLMVTYPTDVHGYTLTPQRASARVHHVKIKAPSGNWSQPTRAPLPRVQTGLPSLEDLSNLLDESIRLWTDKGAPSASLAKLAQAICGWPVSGVESAAELASQVGGRGVVNQSASERVRHAIEVLGHRYDDPPGLDELAAFAKLSPRHFARRFSADFNCTPHEYMTARRLDAARSLLMRSDARVNEVADELNFSSPAAFSRWFTHLAQQTPRQFQQDPQAF